MPDGWVIGYSGGVYYLSEALIGGVKAIIELKEGGDYNGNFKY